MFLTTERLQKFMARCGVASRRACETLIALGRVQVNGRTVTEPGFKVDPDRDEVRVDGRVIRPASDFRYIMLHKPAGYVTTVTDPQGRPTVMALVPADRRLFPVGRLDLDTEGLLLLTDDGALAHRLTHPRYGVPKIYQARVAGAVSEEALSRLRQGVLLEDGPTAPARVRLLRQDADGALLEIELKEGRKRQVRRMCQAVGHPVLYLKRVAFGPLRLGRLPKGRYRPLTPAEVEALKRAAGLSV
ncbi:MAG TPA: pseudouridine synthase [Limnochordales bacterium]